jgi:protein-tyrosine phosphatase
MIDIHCHILPGIDDGPAVSDESVEMARQALEDGIHGVIATPHTLNGLFINRFQEVSVCIDTLRRILKDEHIDLMLYPGAEEHFRPGLVQRILSGESSTLNHTGKYVLVEFPFHSVPVEAKDEFFQLKLKGVTPIIAHPERNTVFQQHPDMLADMIASGALTQITAMSITGELDESVMDFSHQLIKRRMAHIIASDAHSPEYRIPAMSMAVQIAGNILKSESEAMKMVQEYPQAILNGTAVHIPGVDVAKKKWWPFL